MGVFNFWVNKVCGLVLMGFEVWVGFVDDVDVVFMVYNLVIVVMVFE